MRKHWLILILLSFFVIGCSAVENQVEVTDTTKDEVKEVAGTIVENTDFDAMLAGGKLGHESIAFVGAGTSNKLWVIDAKYHKLISTIDAGGPWNERTKHYYPNLNDTHAITFTKDFSLLFTANWYDYDEPSYVLAIDPITLKELWRVEAGKGAHHTALSPDDKYLYVANQHDGTVSVIDIAAKKKIKDIETGEGTCYITPTMYWDGIAIETNYLFVTVDKEDKIAVIDIETNEVIKDIPIEGRAHGINLTPDGKTVWAAVSGAKKIVVIDVDSLEITDEIELEGGPIHISFSPDGKYGYTTIGGNKLHKIDFNTHEILWTSTGTSIPAHTAVTPDGKEFWTLNHGMDSTRYPFTLGGEAVSGVQVWDTETGELITEIVSEGVPHEIQFVPYRVFIQEGFEISSEEVHAKGAHSVTDAAKLIYRESCASCHGEKLNGSSGPELTEVGSKLTPAEIKTVIMGGAGMMPSNLVTETDAKILSNWLSGQKPSNKNH
jgi:YVTN family beta-propeller protein